MKYFYLFIFLFIAPASNAEKVYIVTQDIRYVAENAEEVYMCWGVNGWQHQKEYLWPDGTYEKDGLLFTPMKKTEKGFEIRFFVEPKTVLDYAFRITLAPHNIETDIWDTNKPLDDFHTLATNNNLTEVKSTVAVLPKQPLTILHFAWPILFMCFLAGGVFYLFRKYKRKDISVPASPRRIIFSSAIVLLLFLMLVRTSVMMISWHLYYRPSEHFMDLLRGAYYDYLYVAGITITFLGLLFFIRRYKKAQQIVVHSFLGLSLFSFIMGVANIRIVEMIGKPFNYRWFYYSGFLQSSDSKAAISENLSPDYIFRLLALCCAGAILILLTVRLVSWILHRMPKRKILLTSFVVMNAGYIVLAETGLSDGRFDYNRLANPITAFAESVNPFSEDAALYSIEVPDSLQLKKVQRPFNGPSADKIKNVLIVVLESTAAEFVQPYDQKYKVTPVLNEHLKEAVVFDNFYAHVPATNKSMVCLLGSLYPWLSYTSLTQEHPDADFESLTSVLSDKGFRTAFINAGDNRFQKAGEFLAARKFETIDDCRSLVCDGKFTPVDAQWDPLEGVDDECAGDALISWINQDTSKPFFGMLWTYQTHYPYYTSGEVYDFESSDSTLNRYLNAVYHSDYVLGKILTDLKSKGLYESTLVVVIGDHGEAFGRHNQVAHANEIYEENLRIPCILINPAFNGERIEQPGGMVDIAPTVTGILGLPSASTWQGESLFAVNPDKKIYFFCPWSDYLFGYREGNTKYIYNATLNETEIYDLENDPLETKNLAGKIDDELHQLKLAAWVQYQDGYMKKILKN